MDSSHLQISIDDQRRVDQLCDLAESAWQSGDEPDFGGFFCDDRIPFLRILLTELITVDQNCNNGSLQELQTSYTARLPQHAGLVEEVISSIAMAQASPVSTVWASGTEIDPESFIGRRIGNYIVEELLSVGGFGIVFKASDTMLERPVVIKIPKHIKLDSPKEINAFIDEARKAANLNHRNILGIYHVGIDSGLPFIVEEYVIGGDLGELMSKKRLTATKAVELLRQIVSGVGCAHKNGIVHRDLKPSNILINSEGEPVIADFGLAINEQSAPGQIAGTVRYMSPEQVRGESERIDGRSDIWSLGVMFYGMLTRSFGTASSREKFVREGNSPIKEVNLNLAAIENQHLRSICSKCLQSNVEHRYQSAAELEKDLMDFQLRESETKFQRVAEQLPGMVVRYIIHSDGSDEFVYVSGGVQALFGIEPMQVMANASLFWSRIEKNDLESLQKKMKLAEETPGPFFAEFRIEVPGQGIKWCQSNCQTELLENGDVVWDCVVLDITDRKNSELALRDSISEVVDLESKFERVAAQIPGMVFRYILHPDGSDELAYVSAGATEIFGVDPDEVVEDMSKLWSRIYKEDVERMAVAIEESARTLGMFLFEYRVFAPGGGTRWCHVKSHPERHENGDVVWDGVIIDITEQKESRVELMEAKEKFDGIAANLPGMIFQYMVFPDGSDAISYVSPKCREFFEMEPEEAMSDVAVMYSRVHPGDVARLNELTQEAIRTLNKKVSEFRVVLPQKGVRWLRSVGTPTRKDDGTVLFDGLITDITERKAAQFELEDSKHRLEQLHGNVPGMMYRYIETTGGIRKMVYVSPQCREIFGVDPDEVLADPNLLFRLDHPEDALRIRKATQRSIRQLQDYEEEYRVVLPGGHTRWIHAIGKPTRLDNGCVIVDGMALDITDWKTN